MVSQADREVVFTLKPEVDDDAQAQFDKLASMAEKADSRVAKHVKSIAERMAGDFQGAYSKMGSAAEAVMKASEQKLNGYSKAFNTFMSAQEKGTSRIYAAHEKAAEKAAAVAEKAAQKAAKEQERAAAKAIKEAERAAAAQQKAAEKAAREAEKASRAAEREEEKRYKAQVDRLAKLAKEESRRWEIEKREREKAASEAAKAVERQQKERDALNSKAERAEESRRQSALMMKESAIEAAQGAILAARGFAELGILSEKTSEGLLKAFIRVQAAYDIVEGGFRIYKKLTEGVEAYRKTVEAATVAERALAAARGMGGAASVAGGVAAGAGGIGAGGVAAGAAGAAGAGGLTALLALPGAIAAAVVGSLAAVGMMTNAGGMRDKTAGAMAKSGWFDPGTFMGGAVGYLSSPVTGGPFGWISSTYYGATDPDGATLWEEQERAGKSQERLTKAERERQFRQARAQRFTQEAAIQGAADRERQSIEYNRDVREAQNRIAADYRSRRLGATRDAFAGQAAWEAQRPDMLATDEEKAKWQMAGSRIEMEAAQRQRQLEAMQGRDMASAAQDRARPLAEQAAKQAEAMRSKMAEMLASGTIDGKTITQDSAAQLRAAAEEASKAEMAAMERLSQANRDRLAAEEQIRDVRIMAADEAIGKTREEISLRESLIEKERQRLMSAQERIASMSASEQSEYKRVLDKARGGQDLTAAEFRMIKTVVTEETERLSREYAARMSKDFADRTGLFSTIQDNIARWAKEKQTLEATLKDERELRVNIERDDGALVQQLTDRIVREVGDRDRQMLDEIQRRVQRALDEIGRNQKGLAGAAADAGGA